MRARTAAFVTLGCKINQYETEAIREQVLDLGYREVRMNQPADVYVVNTCSVTKMAGTKSRKLIQRAARTQPDAQIIVVGCSSQEEKKKIREISQVALLAGNREKGMVGSFLAGEWLPGDPIPEGRDVMSLAIRGFEGRTRATVKVQDGCSNYCSFCIIPRLRGLSKSRPVEDVLDELKRLVDAGYKEVVISGVHLQDYGLDLQPRMSLVELLRRVAGVRGLHRIRLSSLGTKAFGAEMLDLMEDPVFCKHWHIPLQAGSDEVLDVMRRGYTLAQFCEAVAGLRSRFPDAGITTDLIVGHPGETDALFEASLAVYRELRFSKIHAFPFSFREGTLAEKLWKKDPGPGAALRERVDRVTELGREMAREFHARFIGRDLNVLVEGPVKRREGWLDGLTEEYIRVAFLAPSQFSAERFPGRFHTLRALEASDRGIDGEWAEVPLLDAGF